MAGRPCSICGHPEREKIEAAILAGRPFRDIARCHETTAMSLLRHRDGHMVDQLAAAAEQRQAAEPEPTPASSPEPPRQSRRQDVAQALDIVQQLQAINGVALEVLQRARRSGDDRLLLQAVDRVERQILLQAKLIGQIDERPTITVWLSAEWLAIEQALLDVLSRYPQARYEVSERLNVLRLAS